MHHNYHTQPFWIQQTMSKHSFQEKDNTKGKPHMLLLKKNGVETPRAHVSTD